MASSRRLLDVPFSAGGICCFFIVLALLFTTANAWDSADLELFDLVEEVQQNFYEVLGIEQSASQAEIRRAYRRLSLQLHPDKNKEEGAEEQFRQLVAVSEVLRDEEQRKRYDEVLEHGLPDWRQPVFYYRRVRKMGLLELSILLSMILTVGHYLVLWSMYFERKLELEALIKPKREKKSKKSNKQTTTQPAAEQTAPSPLEDPTFIQKPSLSDALPCKLARLAVAIVTGIPEAYRCVVENWKSRRRAEEEGEMDEEGEEEDQEERERRKKEQGPREKQRLNPAMYEYDRDASATVTMDTGGVETALNCDVTESEPGEPLAGKASGRFEWTTTDISSLVKAMTKFPGGTPDRWTKIAAEVKKPVDLVTKKAKELKGQKFATNVDASSQGITGAVKGTVTSKKSGFGLTDDITTYSTYQDEEHDEYSAAAPAEDKRHRSTKPVKTTDRTLMISQQNKTDANQFAEDTQTPSLDNKTIHNKEVDELVYSGVENCAWTQRQQKVLEKAMQAFPRGVDNRWEKIAEAVPGKTKEECMIRYKELVEVVKRRKQAATQR